MSAWSRRLLGSAFAVLLASCGINPQPDLPSSDGTSNGAAAGKSSSGGGLNLGGSTVSEPGTGTGGELPPGADPGGQGGAYSESEGGGSPGGEGGASGGEGGASAGAQGAEVEGGGSSAGGTR